MNGGGSAPEQTDEELMRALAGGSEDALRPLYARYAPRVFALAAHSLERATAEEVVQDVFLSLWRNADRYDPTRGPLRPWLLQIAHFRILNELRSRRRRPQAAADDEDGLDALVDLDPEAPTKIWNDYRRGAVRHALDLLPPAQRQALGLAFFDDLTHDQVAEVLQLRLGTAKTRIRTGLSKLREHLVPVLTVLTLASLTSIAGLLHLRDQVEGALLLDERALDLVTSSDVVPLRLGALPGAPPEMHASFRARPGSTIAVLSLSKLPALPKGRVYQAWLRQRGTWISLGTAASINEGKARIIAQGPELAAPPEGLLVTLEPAGVNLAPSGPALIAWPEP